MTEGCLAVSKRNACSLPVDLEMQTVDVGVVLSQLQEPWALYSETGGSEEQMEEGRQHFRSCEEDTGAKGMI